MIDIRVLREDPEGVKAALSRRGVDVAEIDAVLVADVAHRALLTRAESLRADVKALSRAVGEAKRAGDEGRAEELSEQSRRLGAEERTAAAEAEAEGEKVHRGLLYLPNIPADEVPDGASDADNVEIRRWWPGQEAGAAEPKRLDHQHVPHSERPCSCSTWSGERAFRARCSPSTAGPGPGCCGR
jgi:seryl-tRNA synthetase